MGHGLPTGDNSLVGFWSSFYHRFGHQRGFGLPLVNFRPVCEGAPDSGYVDLPCRWRADPAGNVWGTDNLPLKHQCLI